MVVMTSAAVDASLASIGASVLRWLSRADIVAHDLAATIDMSAKSARFVDDVTVRSRGGRTLHVLLGVDFQIDAVSDPATGEALDYGPFLNLGGLPFAIYRVDLPQVSSGEEVQVRFEWRIDQSTIKYLNPFIGSQFFYLGHVMLWHPYTPNEGFFTANINVTAPKGLMIFADGHIVAREEHGSHETVWFETHVPVNGIGIGVGRFERLPDISVGDYVAEAWKPVGVSRMWSGDFRSGVSQIDLVHRYGAQAHQFFAEHLGPLPAQRFQIVEFPFDFAAAYPSMYWLAVGGDLRHVGALDERLLAHIVAHEVAHQWIGSSVGVRVLGSAWLNEGLGEYLGYLATRTMLSEKEHEQLLSERVYTPFIEIAGTRESRALGRIEITDETAYQLRYKGALLFRSLHRRLGDDHFFALIRQFIEAKRGQVVSGSDFITFTREYIRSHADDLADEIGLSYRDVTAFFDRWLKGDPGLDYALDVVQNPADPHSFRIKISSVGQNQEPGPVEVRFRFEDGSTQTNLVPVGNEVDIPLPSAPWLIEVDPRHWLADVNPDNNWWIAPHL